MARGKKTVPVAKSYPLCTRCNVNLALIHWTTCLPCQDEILKSIAAGEGGMIVRAPEVNPTGSAGSGLCFPNKVEILPGL